MPSVCLPLLIWITLCCSSQALLGPSGAGKSTLMDILAQRKSVGNLSGQMLIGGKPVTRSFIRKTSYVPQVRCGLCAVVRYMANSGRLSMQVGMSVCPAPWLVTVIVCAVTNSTIMCQ